MKFALFAFIVPAAILFLADDLLTAAEPSYPVIPLWENGAPGFESRRNEPELAKDWWVKNIHHPSLTVVRPEAGKANGAAVLVIPGGGHRELVFNPEGIEPAQFLAKLGVTAFALKYRLAREPGSPYSLAEHTAADGRRAMRVIRSRAAELGLDPQRIGVMGWSAGGEIVSMISFSGTDGDTTHGDPVERASSRPDFLIMIYPGHVGMPPALNKDAPPALFICADDDRGHARIVTDYLDRYREAGVPMELHLYATGGHGFNMGQRSKLKSIRHFPDRIAEWLEDYGWLGVGNREN